MMRRPLSEGNAHHEAPTPDSGHTLDRDRQTTEKVRVQEARPGDQEM